MCDTLRAPGPTIVRPRWTLLYGAAFAPLGALAVVEMAAPPHGLRTLLRALFTLAAFTGMAVWVRASRRALDMLNWCACAPETVTVRVIESRRPHTVEPLEAPAPVTPEEAWELVPR